MPSVPERRYRKASLTSFSCSIWCRVWLPVAGLALAGLPLLTAYLISAANTGEALSLRYFVLPAALWLVMVGRQGVGLLRRWGTSTPLMSSA